MYYNYSFSRESVIFDVTKLPMLMKKLFLLCSAAAVLAVCTTEAAPRKRPVTQRLPEPQTGGLTPAPPRVPFRLTREKGWVEGEVALDGGAAKLVTLYVPDLTSPGGNRPVSAYLDAQGRFRFEADLYGPTPLFLNYGDGFGNLYLYPDDTLRVSFRSSDFREGNDGNYASLAFGDNRSGMASRHLAGFARLKRGAPVPELAKPVDMESWMAFLRGRDSAERATLARYAAAENPPAEVADLLGRMIGNTYAGYTWQGYMTGQGPVRAEQVRELHRRIGFPVTDDGDFADLPGHCYALYQTGLSYMFSDTSSLRSEREKMACGLDSILVEYPASLSRDVMCLQLFCGLARGGKTPELYAKIYPLRGRYIASPLVRGLVPEPEPRGSEKGEAKGVRNFYDLDLKEAEAFIGRLFEPYRGQGKVVYADVWATWCGPCREEMPNSLKLHGELEGEPVEFLYICIDSKEKDWEVLKKNWESGMGGGMSCCRRTRAISYGVTWVSRGCRRIGSSTRRGACGAARARARGRRGSCC